MTYIEIPKRIEKLGIKGERVLKKENIDGLKKWIRQGSIKNRVFILDKAIIASLKNHLKL